MTKEFNTLLFDIKEYLKGTNRLTEFDINSSTARNIINLSSNVAKHTLDLASHRTFEKKSATDKTIRMSEIGDPCVRKLYYKWYYPEYAAPPYAEEPDPMLEIKFAYGDYTEELFFFLAKEAGHLVTSHQLELTANGISTDWQAVGHIDGLVDGVLVDVKSSADISFKKYQREGLTADNDSFGYRWQLDAYGTALSQQARAFVFVNKHDGHMNVIDRTPEELLPVEERIDYIGKTISHALDVSEPPLRLNTKPDKYGEKLCVNCSYCAFKHMCWNGDLKGFIASGRPHYYTTLTEEGEKYAKGKPQIETPAKAFAFRVESGGLTGETEPPF